MRISVLADRAGVSVKAVRHYESLGLLTPHRLPNGYRDFDEGHLRQVRELRSLRELGISLRQSRPFLNCLAAGHERGDECVEALAEYRDAILDLDRRIHALQQRRMLLQDRLAEAASRRGTQATSHLPPMEADTMTHLEHLPGTLPEPLDDGAATHLRGLLLPGLVFPATNGDTVHLDQFGPGRSVLYLYPLTGRPGVDLPDGWDMIPGARGCTAEACAFRDHHADLLSAGARAVYGLSSQDTIYQRELVERLHLPFAMLSDPAMSLADELGLPTFTAAGQRLYARQTLIVAAGRIEHVFYPVFPPDQHAQEVLDWLSRPHASVGPVPSGP